MVSGLLLRIMKSAYRIVWRPPVSICLYALRAKAPIKQSRLDAHRKRQQQLHPWLTLTEMYSVLEKLRAGTEFAGQDHNI